MSLSTGRSFKRLPIRVALLTTAIFAVLYAVAAIAVLFILRNDLIGDIDGRLARQLSSIQAQPDAVIEAFGGQGADLDNDGDERRFDAPLVVWVQGPGGESFQSDPSAPLPPQYASISGPATANVGGTDMRLVGGPLGGGEQAWVTIAQSASAATTAVNTLLIAELLIAPFLLLAVFVGAVLIGRRVATPIEQARLAQLAFTADASHELRTPLTVIDAETSLALQGESDSAALRQTIVRVREETSELRSLVEDLLWLARFDSAPASPQPEALDLGALAQATVDRFTSISDQRATTVTTEVSGASPPVVNAPPDWMARLLSVLVDNAVRHSPPRSHVWIKVQTDGNRVEMSVEDDGPGIPLDQREQVLNRFHRVGGDPEGAGLGLAIADAIVGSTGGHWQIGESAAGGARMAVWWHRSSDAAFATAITDPDEPEASQSPRS